LKESLEISNLNEPDFAILNPHISKKDGIWTSNDSAFVYTNDGFKNYKSSIFSNLYSVGTHNGNSKYAFTSMESAVSNGITFINDIIPETKSLYYIDSIITVNSVILIGISTLIVLVFIKIMIYNKIYM
jgi:hypothetical protein